MMKRVGMFAVAFLGLTLVSGCAGLRDTRGFVIDDELTKAVQVGVDNKDSVAKSLGRPTFTSQFGGNDWYYVAQKTKQFAFTRPKVTDQTVFHVRFDAAGNVAAVETTDETKIASVDPMRGKTPTLGQKRSFIQELFGNIGSISQPGLPGSSDQGQ